MDDFFEYLSNTFEDFDFKKLIFPIIMILLYAIGFLYLFTIINKKQNTTKIETNIVSKEEKKEEIIDEYIYVDIKGSVQKPGVYRIKNNSRVIDAIEASGGVTKNANTRFLNLSKSLNDGDVVVVYSNEEIEEAKKKDIIYIETPCICEEVKNDACYKEEETSNGKININTATLEELKTISGIGDAKAQAIIKYRSEKGNFKSIEDIKNVSGISDSIYQKIKDLITV